MNKIDEILHGLNFIDEEDGSDGIFEMATLSKVKSGLPYDVWIDSTGKDRKVSHSLPRIKVDIGDGKRVPVSIDKVNPKNLSRNPKTEIPKFSVISKWVIKHYDTLLKHWNHEIDDEDALHMLRKDYKGE